jgi:hypothetical protein
MGISNDKIKGGGSKHKFVAMEIYKPESNRKFEKKTKRGYF